MNKLRSSRGETMIESLCAILIVALVMLFLSTSVATAAKINHQVRTTDVSYHADGINAADATVTVKTDNATYTGSAKAYETTNGYRYYRYQGGTGS